MKVNLQLVVVVLNAPTNFRHDSALHEWRLKFLVPTVTQTLNLLNSPSIQYNTQLLCTRSLTNFVPIDIVQLMYYL